MTKLVETTTNNIDLFDYLEQQQQKEARGQRVAEQLKTTTDPYALGRIMGQSSGRIDGIFSTVDDESLQGGIDFFDYLEQQQQQNVESDKFNPDNSWSEVSEPAPQTPFTPTAPAVEVTDIPANANRTEGNSIPTPNPEPYKSPVEQYFAERVDKPVTAEERLLRGVDKNTEKVLNNVEATFKEAEIDRDTQTPEWSRASFTSDYGEVYEAAKFQTRQRKQAGADVVIKGVLEGVSQEQLRLTVEENIQARPDFKDLQKRMADDVTRISPMSGDLDLSDDQVSAVLDSLPDAERDDANKKIAEVTSNIEALQKYYTSEMERIYTSEYKAVEGKVYNRVIDKLAALKMPKSDLEYIGKAIWNNSLVGMAHELGFTIGAGASGADYVVTQQALAKANPSTAAEIAAGAGTILFDTAVFSALGGVGSLLSAVPRKLAERQVATQIARRAAVSATNKAVKETAKRVVENQAILKFAAATTEQAVSLGGYNAMLTAAQEYLSPTSENGTINWRQIFNRAAEGAITGGVLGSLSTGVQAGKAAMYRANPSMSVTARGLAADVGIDAGAFLAENAAFMGVGSLFSGEPITAEDFGHSVATLGVLKGIGALKRVAKGEKLMQQPDFVKRTISDLKFTKEEMDTMRKAGVDMEQMDIISEAISSANEAPSMGKLQLQTAYNRVMISRDIPTSAKIKLHYIVNGAMPSIAGPSGYSVVEGENGVEVHTTDYLGRLTDIKSFGDVESANKYVSRIAPLLEKNIIVDGAKVISGADALLAMNRAIDEYMTTSAYLESGQFASKSELMSEMLIANGAQKGTIPENSRARVETIQALAQNHKKTIDTVSALQGFVAKQHGATVSELLHAINVKPDLRTSREALLVKDYVDALTAFNGSISGRAESQQAQREAQMRPQIEQAKQEVAEAQREADAIRESLNDAARKLSTADGQQIAVVRLESGEQVAVYRGRIALNSDGTIDRQASENMVVIKRIDAAGNEVRAMISIDDIVEVVEQASSQEVVNATMDYIEKVAAKKHALDKAVIDSDGKGVEVEAIDGSKGKIMGYDENGAYIYRVKDSSGRDMDIPVSIEDISKLIEPQSDIEPTAETSEPQTIEGAAVSDAVEQVVEAVPAADDNTIVEYDEDFPPITEQDLAPQLDPDKIEWDTLSPEDYSNASAIIFGDAETLSASHNYYTNSRDDLVKAKARVAEQQKVVERLKGRFATLSSPSQAQKLRKQVASAEQEKMKREQEVKNIEEQMSKYAYAMRKYGFDATTEERLLAEKADLEAERNALVEADAELDRYEQSEAAKVGKAISNTEANRNYIEQLYADRLGVSPSQAGPRQAVLWDLANGAIKLRWENTAPNAGAVQKGLAAELGLTGSAGERKAYKAVIAKDGQSVDGYVHDLWQRADWGADVDDMALKDIVLATLQSVPNGSLALKELLDMSGVQADLEAQISLGKGDIQRKLEEVDASLAKNSQQMADFRKRINNAVQKLENGEPLIIPIGEGEFGPIYDQFRGRPQEAVNFLLTEKNGEAIGALTHPEIGDVSLVYGNKFAGLEKIAQKHPEVLQDIQGVLDTTSVKQSSDNRIVLEGPSHKVVVSKMLGQKETPQWLLTAYEKNSATGGSSDIDPEPTSGKQNGTATLQNTASENKGTTTIPENQISEEEIFNTPTLPTNEDIPFMIEQKPTEQAVSETEQNFEREVFDAFAGHLGETLGAESVVTDAAEANRVLEWHQAVGERLRTAVRENAEIAAERAEIERVAKENGTWLKAPNGKDTNLTSKQWVDVRTSRFKSWFGDWENDPANASKVVDENGEPKVVYHGTKSDFYTFGKEYTGTNLDYGTAGEGFYFTEDKQNAQNYANNAQGEGVSKVIPVFLTIKNPKDAWFLELDGSQKQAEKFTTKAVAKGFDGVQASGIKDIKWWVTFNPNQIKSATENTGEYSADNADIRMSIAAYHGSGADFEKFDLSFIGTGEGMQAYGHGIYVTTRKGIAENYADTIGGDIQQERRYEARTNLLVIRKNIADENQAIEKWEKAIQQMKQTYAELESNTPFFKTRSGIENHKKTLQELQEEIDSTQALIDSSKARVKELKPLEEAADKEWQAMEAPDKIRELNTQIELHEANLKSQQISIAAMQQRAKIKQAEYDYYNEQLAELKRKYGVNSPEYKEYVFKNDYIESEHKNMSKYIEDTKGQIGYLEKWIADEKAELARLKEIQKPFRNLYTVEVPDNTGDNYLSWDKEVPATMIERINNYIKENYGWKAHSEADLKQGMTGEQVYKNLTRAWGTQGGASMLLSDIGFVGNEYPAQYTTGGRADGAKNYVIFDADDVKIVDHMQYFKTPNGEVHGFVYENKLYLDPTNIDPKSPVHEYTELWCREVAKANEALWKRGKELVKQTKVWEEVNADENYKNQSEDLRASEAWSRIVADEMMGKARQYGSKGLMAKLRGWLRSFWKTVKSVVGKWTKKDLDDLTVDQFKKMTMADFINKVDPRKWNAKRPTEVSKSLVGIHNISLDKLQKALKQGGLANPSAAVIDIAKQNHEGYGEYSLIMPKSLVDATSGRNAGTFTGDAWTPTYPTIVRQLDTKGWEIVKNKISTAVGDSKELYADIVNGVRNFLEDNRSSKLEYVFLKEKGIEPVVQYKGADGFVGIANLEAILGVSNITEGIEAYKRYQNAKPIYRYDFNRWASVNGNKAEFAKLKAQIKENPALKKDVDADLSFAQFDSFVNGIYKKEREAGNIDTSNTLLSASIYVDKNGLREEFESWIDTLMESAEAKEVFYAGIDRNGDRIYKPNTLENVSRHMLTEGMQNAYNNGGLSATKATLLQRLTTLSEIRQNKDRLSDGGKYNKEFDKLSDRLFNIITAISDMQEISSNRFMNIDYAELRLQDALAKRDPIAYLNKEYGYNIEKDSDLAKEIKSFVGDVRKMPAKYFETKFERPVMFNEFAAVVAPDTMPESVEQQLRDAGLAIYKYNPDVEGDRRKATLAATASEDIRFMIVGEKGAAALDQAEEATTRLDNLAVAREMEEANRDAKAIKLATGWERGADGKWRYETQDFITRKVFTKVVNNGTAHNAYVKSEMERINKQTAWLKEIIDGLNADWVDEHIYGKSEPTLAERYPEKAQEMKDYFAQFANKDKAQKEFNRLMEYAKVVGRLGKNEYMLDEFVEDKSLFSAYPSLRNVKVVIEENRKQNYGGNWNKEKQSITIVNYKDKGLYEHTSLLHEVQHAIQDLEGFAQGGSPEIQKPDTEDAKRLREIVKRAISFVEFFQNEDIASVIRDSKKYGSLQWESIGKESQDVLLEYLGNKRKVKYEDIRKYLDNAFNMTLPRKYGKAGYKKFAGEVEARNVGIRKDMTPEERRATLLSETEDVAREDQIFLENNLGVAQSVEVSEPIEAPTRKPRKSAAEKSLEKIESLREQLKNKKRSLNGTLFDVYNFLTSKDIAETMGEGVGKAQYRRVIKNSIEAISKAYDVTEAEEKRKTIFKYLGEIDDSLSQLLTRQRLNEVTDILDKAIYGYTAQGVRIGKRIDEHTREIFDILRNAIAEPVEEERDDSGRRKPVRYRLKNRTEAGDITSSFRLRSEGDSTGIIAKLRSEADDIIALADKLDSAAAHSAAQLEYTANLLESYDNTLQLNEAIGKSTDRIAEILDDIDRINEKYKSAVAGSEERKNFNEVKKQLQVDLDSEKMNRTALRHRYAELLKTFTLSLKQLDDKGAGEFEREMFAKAEQTVKWRRGIYDSIKDPDAPVLPASDYDRSGERVKVNWKGLNTRAKINESPFMATFAEMSRDIDINSIPGQWLPSGFYYQFMLAPDGYMARVDWRYKQVKAFREELDAQVLKLSDNKKANNPYQLFARLAQEPSGLVIRRIAVSTNKNGKAVGGYQENIPVTISMALQMRATIRQTNGYAGYAAWQFSETYMQNIAQYIESKFPIYCRFADWVVYELWPKLYEIQDAIYFEKTGTHLLKTEGYHPFVRDKRFVGKLAEVGEDEVSLPSSVTGNIVERVKTSAKMDLQADFFTVVQDHIEETLTWCAFVGLTDKFNSLVTSRTFGNILKAQGVSVERLKKMYEIAIGQGKINSTENTVLTKVLNAASKGLVAGNIAFNPNAAVKQIVSATAVLGYSANPKLLPLWAKNFFVPSVVKTGIGKVIQKLKSGEINPVEVINWKVVGDNWKWAIENIPTLRERWEGREAGFETLKSHSFESWDKLTAMIANVGLAPNAFIDMLTCANAAKTVYEYEYPRLVERGRSREEAHREACVKAAIFINETQQSSLNGFLSSFQSGGGLQRILGVGLGAYQNSSMAFARNERFAFTNLLRMMSPKTRKDMETRQIAAYSALGVKDEDIVKLTKADMRESYGQQFASFAHNGIFNNFVWGVAGVIMPALLTGGFAAMFDKDEWNKVWKNEKLRQELASAVSVETLIVQMPLFFNSPIWKQAITYLSNALNGKTWGGIFESPTEQGAQEFIDAVAKQWIGVKNEITGERERQEPTRYDRSAEWIVLNTFIKAGLGLNIDLIVRIAEGMNDAVIDGEVNAEDVMNVLSSPRGLTRAIAGTPRADETQQQYLDRLSYIYHQVNAGSGKYDKRFVAERTREYIQQKDAEIYRELGIVPRDARVLEARVKSIKKMLLYFDRSEEGRAEFNSLPQSKRDMQKEIAKEYNRVYQYTRALNNGVQSYDAANIAKRKQYLRERYEAMRRVSELWVEYNKK